DAGCLEAGIRFAIAGRTAVRAPPKMLASIVFAILLAATSMASAVDFDSMPTPELQRRYDGLIHELRCMQCQNESIADSPVVLLALLFGGAGLYALLSNYAWVEAPAVADTPAAMAAKLAKKLADHPENLDGWLMLGRTYATLEQYPLAVRAYQHADRLADGKNAEAIVGMAESLL